MKIMQTDKYYNDIMFLIRDLMIAPSRFNECYIPVIQSYIQYLKKNYLGMYYDDKKFIVVGFLLRTRVIEVLFVNTDSKYKAVSSLESFFRNRDSWG